MLAAPMSEPRRWFRWIFAALGLAYVGITIWSAARSGELVMPSPSAIALSLALISAGVWSASASWAMLFRDPEDRRRLQSVFLLGQLGKYTPAGGLGQAVGQIGMSKTERWSAREVTGAFVLHSIFQIAAAATLAGFLVLDPNLPPWLRAVLSLGFVTPLLVGGRALEMIVERLGRRYPKWTVSLPDRTTRLKVLGMLTIPLTCSGLALGLVMSGMSDLHPLVAVPAFAASWAVGFIAIPVPAGLGVREALLGLLLPVSAGVVTAASLSIRIMTVGVEAVLAALYWRAGAPAARRSPNG
jgi:uncharacterized membrane protein YbhN (UPF0104 family)